MWCYRRKRQEEKKIEVATPSARRIPNASSAQSLPRYCREQSHDILILPQFPRTPNLPEVHLEKFLIRVSDYARYASCAGGNGYEAGRNGNSRRRAASSSGAP